MTTTSPFHFLIKLPSQKQTNNSFSHISDGERMIYKNLPDCASFNHLCKQIWRLIRATLISRNYASASWMPLPWLQDSTAIKEATFIKSKLERSLAVLSLPLTEEWPQLNSLWWHWQLINGLIAAPCPFRVTCSSQHRTFFMLQLLERSVLDLPAQEVSYQQYLPLLMRWWLVLFLQAAGSCQWARWKAASPLHAAAGSEALVKGKETISHFHVWLDI